MKSICATPLAASKYVRLDLRLEKSLDRAEGVSYIKNDSVSKLPKQKGSYFNFLILRPFFEHLHALIDCQIAYKPSFQIVSHHVSTSCT